MALFNNIRTVLRGGTEQADIIRSITIFIVRRCAPIISHRLQSDKLIFQDTTLDKILRGWEPSDEDRFVKAECEVPKHVILLFQTMGIQCQQSNGKYFAPWTKEIAPAWMKAFLSCLLLCKDCFKLEGKKVAGDTTMGATVLKLLQALVASEGFKYFLELKSVKAILDEEVLKCREGTIYSHFQCGAHDLKAQPPSSTCSNTEIPEDSTDPQRCTLDDTYDDNLELAAETEEDSVALTLQYLGNAVAWITATEFLFSSSRIQRTPKLRLHLVTTAPPVEPKAMADAPAIFTDIFNKSLEGREDQSQDHNLIVHSWWEEFTQEVRKSREFHGTVHCEASLMGVIVQYNGQANTEGNMQNTQLPDIFCVRCWMSYTFGGMLIIFF